MKYSLNARYLVCFTFFLLVFSVVLIWGGGENTDKTLLNVADINQNRFVIEKISNPKDAYELFVDEGFVEVVKGKITETYLYNGEFPGPLIRGKVGDQVEVVVHNRLDVPTTVHWHGLQIDNSMDGVPDVTQEAILPGESFEYTLDLRNPGLYWYHSHFDSSYQVDKGLQGIILVEDDGEVYYDDQVILVLDDILLGKDYKVMPGGIGAMHGRFGNYFLVNGEIDPKLLIKNGLVRVRIVNTANARTFNLMFNEKIIEVIGQDIGSFDRYTTDYITISPGERYDILVNFTEEDLSFYYFTSRGYNRLGTFVSNGESNVDKEFLKDNFSSGFSPSFSIKEALEKEADLSLSLQGVMSHRSLTWTIDGHSYPEDPRIYTVKEGDLVKIKLFNTQGQPHPMHLHGQKFLVLSRNGVVEEKYGWKDTVMVNGRETVEIAFIAEEKGNWVFHCHILEHTEAGMLSILRVA